MKKALAAFFSFFLGAFGLAAVDKTIEARVSKLENESFSAQSAMSSMGVELSKLSSIHNTTLKSTGTNPNITTTATTATTLNIYAWQDFRECPYYDFWDFSGNNIRITIQEHRYKLNRIIPKSNNPQTLEELHDRYVYDVHIRAQVPVEYAGKEIAIAEYRTTINADGTFEINCQSESFSIGAPSVPTPTTTTTYNVFA